MLRRRWSDRRPHAEGGSGNGLAGQGVVTGTAVPLCLMPNLPAAGATPANGVGAQLTGSFSVVLPGTSPKSVHGARYHLSWSFTPECDDGPCAVQVDTLANSCPSGSCAQPPSGKLQR
jgi:hypothetical protein